MTLLILRGLTAAAAAEVRFAAPEAAGATLGLPLELDVAGLLGDGVENFFKSCLALGFDGSGEEALLRLSNACLDSLRALPPRAVALRAPYLNQKPGHVYAFDTAHVTLYRRRDFTPYAQMERAFAEVRAACGRGVCAFGQLRGVRLVIKPLGADYAEARVLAGPGAA